MIAILDASTSVSAALKAELFMFHYGLGIAAGYQLFDGLNIQQQRVSLRRRPMYKERE